MTASTRQVQSCEKPGTSAVLRHAWTQSGIVDQLEAGRLTEVGALGLFIAHRLARHEREQRHASRVTALFGAVR